MNQPTDWKEQARVTACKNCSDFFDSMDLVDGVPDLASPVTLPEGTEQGPLLLRTLFGDGARVVVATGKSNSATRVVVTGKFRIQKPELPEGAWFKVNRVVSEKPSGRQGGWADADVGTQYLLLEMDRAGYSEQLLFWRAAIHAGFPVVSLSTSGGKSLHAIVKTGAGNAREYGQTADRIMSLLAPFIPDSSTRNPSRYSRLPGVFRGPEKRPQTLLYLNPEAPVWSDQLPAAVLLRSFATQAVPIPEKLCKALQRSAEDRQRPEDGGDTKEFMKRLGKVAGQHQVDVERLVMDAGWHQFSAEEVAGMESKHFVDCPWAGEHTGSGENDTPTDAYIFRRTSGARMPWGFHCSHHACQGRGIIDVLELAHTDMPEVLEACLEPEPDALAAFDGVPDEPEAPAPAPAEEDWGVPESVLAAPPCDVDNCRIFMALHRSRVRHARSPSRWYVWDTTRWKRDTTGRAEYLAKDVEKRRQKAAGADEDARKMAKGAGSAKSIASILSLASAEPAVAVESTAFDADPFLVGCPNGTLDLRTRTLRPASPADMISLQVSCRYNPGAPCRRWGQFGEEIHPDDPDITSFLGRWAGYCLSGDTREDKMLIFHGPKGRNGKSTWVRVISGILGEYSIAMPEGFLAARKGGSDPNAPNAPMAALLRKRLALISETNEAVMLDEAKVKTLTGGENISVRRVFGTEQEQMPLTSKIIVSSNHRPEIKGTDPAIWSRILLVPFKQTFADNPDRDLYAKLMAEKEGILAWMVRGFHEYQERGLDIPQSIIASTREYRAEEDHLKMFLDECAELDPGAAVPKSELHNAYRRWAEANSVFPVWSSMMFSRKMVEKGFTDCRTKTERSWTGVGLPHAP